MKGVFTIRAYRIVEIRTLLLLRVTQCFAHMVIESANISKWSVLFSVLSVRECLTNILFVVLRISNEVNVPHYICVVFKDLIH